MSTTPSPVLEAIERLKNLFIEIPGTKLSATEVSRLAGVEPERCESVLHALVASGFLTRARDGRLRRP